MFAFTATTLAAGSITFTRQRRLGGERILMWNPIVLAGVTTLLGCCMRTEAVTLNV